MLSNNKQETLLITGAAGYIGSHLLKRALEEGYRVNVLDCTNPVGEEVIHLFNHSDVCFFKGSVTDVDVLRDSMVGVDHIIHLAAISDAKAGKENPELTHNVNREALERMLTLARTAGVQRFLFASTMGVYGTNYNEPLHENLPVNPVEPYSKSKADAEVAVRQANIDGFCTTTLRIAAVYGIGPKVREDFLANDLCIRAIREGKISIFGGTQRRPQIHIDDLASLFLSLLHESSNKVGGLIFNAVASNPSLSDIVGFIKEFLPETSVSWLPARVVEHSFEMDGRMLFEHTGFKPAIGLKEGLQEIINHYQNALVG